MTGVRVPIHGNSTPVLFISVPMKRLSFFFISVCMFFMQQVTAQEFLKNSPFKNTFNAKDVQKAIDKIKDCYKVENGAVSFIQTIDDLPHKATTVYPYALKYMTESYKITKYKILQNNPERGFVIGEGEFNAFESYAAYPNQYLFTCNPSLRIDAQDGVIRVCVSVKSYDQIRTNGNIKEDKDINVVDVSPINPDNDDSKKMYNKVFLSLAFIAKEVIEDFNSYIHNHLSNTDVQVLAKTSGTGQLQKENSVTSADMPNGNTIIKNDNSDSANSKVDVDIDIPVSSTKNVDTYCVIMANENYREVPKVEYAKRDGEVFKEYCIKTLGIPEKQIKYFSDATYNDIKRAINWIESISSVTDGNSKILFYYAGHGLPCDEDKTSFIIPIDGFPKDITTCYKLSNLYSCLGRINAQSVFVFLDACFSGIERGSNQALVTARSVAIKPKEETLSGNMVVFAATTDEETALSYKEKRHGLFTYFLLKELKDSKGKIKLGDLYTSILSKVKKNSILENDKLQTPSINVSNNMKETWKNIYF